MMKSDHLDVLRQVRALFSKTPGLQGREYDALGAEFNRVIREMECPPDAYVDDGDWQAFRFKFFSKLTAEHRRIVLSGLTGLDLNLNTTHSDEDRMLRWLRDRIALINRRDVTVPATYKRIAHLIGAIYFYGGFRAETANERELESLLRTVGSFYETEADVLAAAGAQTNE